MKKNFCLILLAFLALASCGRKAGTEYLPDAKRPKFDHVIDEI